jgi:glycine hydroxymethyltransferase
MILIDIGRSKPLLNGVIAQRVLEDCGIVVDSFRLPFQQSEMPSAGVRLGTPIVTMRGMESEQIEMVGTLIDTVLENVQSTGPDSFEMNESLAGQIKQRVTDLCNQFTPL